MAVGDFNGDGRADMAIANLGIEYLCCPGHYTNGSVSVLLANGDGTFQDAVTYEQASSPSCLAVGDFNGDGKSDLVMGKSGTTNVSVRLGNGDGTFGAPTDFGAGPSPISLAVGDLNGDGKLDLAVVNFGADLRSPHSGSVSVLLGIGDGSFRSAVNYAEGIDPFSIAIADFNGDGKPDLVVANDGFYKNILYHDYDNVMVLLGKGDGTFNSPVTFFAGLSPRSVAVGDVNGDGKPDIVVGKQYGTAVLLNTCGSAGFDLTLGRRGAGLNLSWPSLLRLRPRIHDQPDELATRRRSAQNQQRPFGGDVPS